VPKGIEIPFFTLWPVYLAKGELVCVHAITTSTTTYIEILTAYLHEF